MSQEAILQDHRCELARHNPVYRLFEPLEQAGLSPDDMAALRQEASELVDLVLYHGLTAGPESVQSMDDVVKLGMPDSLKALSAWRASLAAAHPSRKAMHMVLNDFRALIPPKAPDRACFLELAPKIARSLPRLGLGGAYEMVAAARTLEEPGKRQTLMACAAEYGPISAPVVLGMCRFVRRALEWDRPDFIERLRIAAPGDKMEEDIDAERLIPELAGVTETLAGRDKECWSAASELLVALAEENSSSAFVAARGLRRRLRVLPADLTFAYLQDFMALVRTTGIRVIGFALRALPGFYKTYGVERTRAFVEAAAEAAEAYGATAGQSFYERKTAAARRMLESLSQK